jgi:hypothetical protein
MLAVVLYVEIPRRTNLKCVVIFTAKATIYFSSATIAVPAQV